MSSRRAIERTRVCESGHSFITSESVPAEAIKVIRTSGTVEPLNRAFVLERSIAVAADGTLGQDAIERIADDVLRRLTSDDGPDTVASRQIGEVVLQELSIRAPSAAFRYALTFLPKHGVVSNVEQLLAWMVEHIPAVARRAEHQTLREYQDGPQVVAGNSAPARSRSVEFDEFSLEKLYSTVRAAVIGLVPSSWLVSSHTEGGVEVFAGSVVAWVLQQIDGQAIVTAGQIQAEVLRVLRAECPLGYLRLSSAAKGLNSLDDLLAECYGLIDRPSSEIDLHPLYDRGHEIAAKLGEL